MLLLRLSFLLLPASALGTTTASATTGALKFGHSLLGTEFLLNYTNFNHGSYGACPQSVLNYQSSLRLQQEQQPDVWMRKHYKVLLNETRNKLANYLQMSATEAETLVVVESASTAVNSILRSFDWQEGDIILMFSMAFSMVKHTADWLTKLYGIQIMYMPIPFPIPDDSNSSSNVFVDALQASLTNLTNTDAISKLKMIVLDHMVSVPAVKEPIHVLAAMVKHYQPDCFVLVDGAHAMGQIPLHYRNHKTSLSQQPSLYFNMDAYLSNGHKWLYSPKGSAILWVNASRVTPFFPEPTVIASLNNVAADTDTGTGIALSERYSYVSARDYTAWLSMSAAIDFRAQQLGGEDAIYQYCRSLALEAKHYLMNLWNTSDTMLVPDQLEEFMIHVQLPTTIVDSIDKGLALQDYLLQQHNTYIRNIYDASSNIFYTRLSAQVYLEMQDFVLLGQRVLDFADVAKSLPKEENSCPPAAATTTTTQS